MDIHDEVEEEATVPKDMAEERTASPVNDILTSITVRPVTESMAIVSQGAQKVDVLFSNSTMEVSNDLEAAIGESVADKFHVSEFPKDGDTKTMILDAGETEIQTGKPQAPMEDINSSISQSLTKSVGKTITVEDGVTLATMHENRTNNAQLMTPEATQVVEQVPIQGVEEAADTQESQSSTSQPAELTPYNNARTEPPVPKTPVRVTRSVSVQLQEAPNIRETPSMREQGEVTRESKTGAAPKSPAFTRMTRSKASVQHEEIISDTHGAHTSLPQQVEHTSQIVADVQPSTPGRVTRAAAQKALREVSLPLPTTPKQLTPTTRAGSTIQSSPMEPATPGYDASAELAISTLESPTISTHDTPAALRARLMKSLRVNVPDATALKVLRFNLGKKIDVLAIATTQSPAPEKAQGGPRHHHLRFNVTDPSIAQAQ